jgi:hypothetical protein
MMNAGIFLVSAVHEIAIAAEFAMATRAAEKANTHPLTDRPALDTGTKGFDPPDDFMTWDARPIDRKQAFHRGGIRVADPTRLDANAYMIGTGIQKWLSYFREFSQDARERKESLARLVETIGDPCLKRLGTPTWAMMPCSRRAKRDHPAASTL